MLRQYPKWINCILTVFVVLFSLVLTNDTVLFGTNEKRVFIIVSELAMALACFVMLIMSYAMNIKFSFNKIAWPLIMCVLILVTMVVNSDYKFGYIYKILLIIFSMLIVIWVPFDRFAYLINRAILFISFVSIVGYICFVMFPGTFEALPITTNAAGSQFYNAGIFIMPVDSFDRYGSFVRNWGFFREPGVYQVYIVVALLFQVLILRRKRWLELLVFTIALILTKSTTGYIAFFVVAFIMLIDNDFFEKKQKKLISTMMIIAIAAVLLFSNALELIIQLGDDVLFDKIKNIYSNARYASIVVNIEMFLKNPVFGLGSTKVAYLFSSTAKSILGVSTFDNTNTLLIQFAGFGFVYGLIWLFSFIKMSLSISLNNCVRLLAFILILVICVGEDMSYSTLINILLLYGLQSKVFIKNHFICGELNEKNSCVD